MTIDVRYSQLQAQTNSAKSACQQLKSALPALQNAIMQIINHNNLKGKAIRSAQQYAQQLAIPVLLAAQEVIDYFETGIEKFTSNYFDKKDWCDDDLKEKIDQLKKQQTINAFMLSAMKKFSTKGMSAKAKASRKDVMSSLSKANETLTNQIEKYEEILRKLEEYDAKSTQFLSNFSSLYQKVATGIQQASTSYNPVSGIFNLPSTEDLAWKKSFKSIHSQQTVIQQLNKKTLSQKEIANLMNTVILYPGLTVGMTTDQYKKLMMYAQLAYQNYDSIENDLSKKVKHILKLTYKKIQEDPYISEIISSIKENMISKGIDDVGNILNNSINSLNDYQFSIQNYGMGLSQIKNLSKSMKVIGKSVGLASFGYGVYDDVKNEGKNYGQAIVHNGSNILFGAATIGVISLTGVTMTLPAVIVVSAISNVIFNKLYSGKVEDDFDELGNNLNDAGKKVKHDIKSIDKDLKNLNVQEKMDKVQGYINDNVTIDDIYIKNANHQNIINGYRRE